MVLDYMLELLTKESLEETLKVKNLTFDYNLDAPSLKGNSGIAEIGIRYTKFDNKKERFVIDLGTQESIGKKKGVSGTLSLKYEF